MPFTTLISTSQLAARCDDPNWVIVDCRFSLTDPAAGRRSYLADHIPGAVYAHLDEDLSSPPIPGKTGRHPLPPLDAFMRTLSAWGIDTRCRSSCTMTPAAFTPVAYGGCCAGWGTMP